MKIAIVHDYLAQDGGAEKVLDVFREMWPEAPVFVLFYDKKGMPRYADADIRESFIARLPFGRTKYQWYLPLMTMATERHDLSQFDVVLSATSAFAKGVITRPDTLHISYCHTPTRYLWTDTHEYIRDLKYPFFIKALLPPLIHRLRLWDRMSTDRVDYFIANSGTVRQRIEKYYRRESDILYPPVDLTGTGIAASLGDYFISGGRFVPYKRFDLLVHVFNRLGWPLKLFGTGPELERLKKIAKPNIEFLGYVSDTEKTRLLMQAKAFLHPQVEDFGITPIESMACGRPVIAYGVGGATETVIPGKTGTLFCNQTWEALLDTLMQFDADAWHPEEIRAWALRYDKEGFKSRMRDYVENKYEAFKSGMQQCRLDIR